MTEYFKYYFYGRAQEMDYSVSPPTAARNDSLLNMLSGNDLAVDDYKQQRRSAPPIPLRQAFMSAAKAFHSIDAPTQGVIVPYGVEGHELVADLCASFQPERHFDLLRRAQQFSVNVFPHEFDALQRAGAVAPIDQGAAKSIGIYHLNPQFYSKDFGLSMTPVTPMETLHV